MLVDFMFLVWYKLSVSIAGIKVDHGKKLDKMVIRLTIAVQTKKKRKSKHAGLQREARHINIAG